MSAERPTAAEHVARFCLTLDPEEIPEHVRVEAKLHLLDALGVALAASSLRAGQALERAVRRAGSGSDASAVGFAEPLGAPWAALLNGALIHSLEYDDTHTGSVIHGSSLVLPAVLAVAQGRRRSGPETLATFVAGWETLVRLGAAAPGAFQARGFQTTAVCGPFVAAAIAARLYGLSLAEATHAIGIAGSQASGVFAYLADGATVKSLHPGWAAHAGLVAAHLATGGMSGPREIFETRFGFYRVYADTSTERLRDELSSLGAAWELPRASVKLYPCCHFIHPFLECVSTLVREGGLSPSDIASIECAVPVEEAPIICDPWERRIAPTTGYEAKFSLPYCLATLVVHGAVDVDSFAADSLSPDAIAFAPRIRYRALERSGYPQHFPGHVRLALRNGTIREASVADVRGSPSRPVSADDVVTKFLSNAVRRIERDAAERVVERVMRLETLSTIDPVIRDLRPGSEGHA